MSRFVKVITNSLMKTVFTLFLALFYVTGLFGQTDCTVKIVFAMNKTNPPGYTFQTDPQIAGATYYWSFGDNTFSDSPAPTHSFGKTADYLVQVKVKGPDGKACYGELKAMFEGPANPCTVRILYEKTDASPVTYRFKTDPVNTAAKYYWTFGDNAVSDSPSPLHSFSKTGTYPVVVKVLGADGKVCYGELKAEFAGGTASTTPCTVKNLYEKSDASPVSYRLKTDPLNTASKYYWKFSDNNVSDSPNPLHAFGQAGTYSVAVKVTGSDGSACYGELKAEFAGGTATTTACRVKILYEKTDASPVTYRFKTDPLNTAAKYYWSFGDNTVSDTPNPLHSFSKTGTYPVVVKVLGADGKVCYGELKADFIGGTATATACKAYFSATNKVWSDPASMKKVVFKNLSTGDIRECKWSFGDNTTGNELNPVHEYPAFGTYKVCLTIATVGGCVSDYCAEVKVDNYVTDAGCKFEVVAKPKENTPLTYLFYAVSATEIKSWKWNFGDGKTSDAKNPEHTYEKTGVYEVSSSVTTVAGCTSTVTIKLSVPNVVLPGCKGPLSLLLFDPTDLKCNGSATVKLLSETNTELPNVKYSWNDGRTGNTVTGLCPEKTYTVQAVVENVCQKNTSFTLLSKPLWRASTINGQNNFTVIEPLEGVTYEWNFGDGTIKTGASVTYDFKKDGVYDVRLKATGLSGTAENTQQVVILKNASITQVVNSTLLEVYPNPASDILRVDFKESAGGAITMEIRNMSGQVVYIEKITSDGSSHADINIQNLTPGMYVLRVSDEKQVIGDRKFIKVN